MQANNGQSDLLEFEEEKEEEEEEIEKKSECKKPLNSARKFITALALSVPCEDNYKFTTPSTNLDQNYEYLRAGIRNDMLIV